MMMLVTFQFAPDTTQAQQDAFVEQLKGMGNWSNRLDNAWLLESNLRPRQVRDLLATTMQPGDKVFVARITQNWAGRGMGSGFPEWLGRRNFGFTAPNS